MILNEHIFVSEHVKHLLHGIIKDMRMNNVMFILALRIKIVCSTALTHIDTYIINM